MQTRTAAHTFDQVRLSASSSSYSSTDATRTPSQRETACGPAGTRLPPPSPAPPPNLITSPHSHPPAPARPFDAIQYPKDGPLAPHDPLQAQPLVPPVSQLARPPLPRLRPPLDTAKDARVACQAEESEWWGRSGAGSSAEAGAVARGDRLRVATRWSLCFRHSRSLPKMLVEWPRRDPSFSPPSSQASGHFEGWRGYDRGQGWRRVGVERAAASAKRDQAVTFSITLHHPADSPWDLPKLVEQTASSLTSLSPNNVRLFFPRSGRSLYANETFLSNASPYFKTLFEAGFSKDDKAAADRTSTAETLPPYTFDDSDDETDGFLDKPTSSSEPSSIPCKTIKIIDTAYSTYFAVLVWLVTGKISFAPSRSSRTMPPPRPSSAASTRSMAIKTAIDAQTVPVPPPVSAKSVYRLAHLLKLDSLASFALSQIRSQLTIENVAYTLYSDIASAYPEVQSAALDFAVEKWEKVVGAEATNEMERLAEGGEADSAMAATAMKLAKRLAGRIK
ncbi:BTB/POZ-like domain containing protein [Rhodotorula toruloides NP11]|uniref:BTB/POZ-like domain containing protein n=1 Tax=Rhodotorula toruloides (strain NP11) TaxID=1130832 RepID=M7WSI1_RHOT1|nr:BTB/POZ-like domain containing protein [Rhodotorula toruloides NP11]EMS23532.1 BTB/POZ-like domain containing protein [Rhodotorula toruloides NP11]